MKDFQLGESIKGLIVDGTDQASIEEEGADPLSADEGLAL